METIDQDLMERIDEAWRTLSDAFLKLAEACSKNIDALGKIVNAFDGIEVEGDDGETYIWHTVSGSTLDQEDLGHVPPDICEGCDKDGRGMTALGESSCTIVNHSETN